MIKLSHVSVSEETAERIKQLVLDGKVGQSDVIEEFEEYFSKWIGTKYAVAVSSGTMADTISLAVLKTFFPNKTDVLVPALTFIAQVNAVLYNGLKPIFMDGEYFPERDPENVLAYFPVHLLGKPATILYSRYPTLEDSCEAIGSRWNNFHCGTTGVMGTFSFFPSHAMTTGEGGMIVTDVEHYANLARRLRNHGKTHPSDFKFDVVGFNGKMTSTQAALGIGALRTLDQDIEKRRKIFFALGGEESEKEYISPHAFPVMCENEEERNTTLKRLRENGVECRTLFSCIPTQERAYAFLGHKLGDFPISEDVGRRGLYVPCHQGLTDEDVAKIKSLLEEK